VSLKKSVEGKLKISTRIRLGRPGALDVFVDGQRVYSKKQTGRLPTVNEIIELIRARMTLVSLGPEAGEAIEKSGETP
jgi:selT/selW/selH-like putative selenoprotein